MASIRLAGRWNIRELDLRFIDRGFLLVDDFQLFSYQLDKMTLVSGNTDACLFPEFSITVTEYSEDFLDVFVFWCGLDITLVDR